MNYEMILIEKLTDAVKGQGHNIEALSEIVSELAVRIRALESQAAEQRIPVRHSLRELSDKASAQIININEVRPQ